MKKYPRRDAALEGGWRSGLEDQIGAELEAAGIKAEYEPFRIPFTQPVKPRHYTPDFILPNSIIIETKGRFVTADRQKHKLIKEQHPHLDIRFVFSNSRQRISKQSKTTYAAWCEHNGFKYADKHVPASWYKEPESILTHRAVQQLQKGQ